MTLLVAALFQLFDGLQVVATGILRGTGDTRTPMLSNLIGHWLLGLPVGYALCFHWNRGVVGLWLGLPPRDWAVLLLTIAMVWAAEFFNTAIEAVVDLASPAKHPLAKVGKDVGAAAVLIAALAAIGVGLLILGPPLWEKMGNLNSRALESERSEELAFKGMELYSWQSEAGEWQYAILVGTNRNKTLDEVRATSLDLQEVKATIEKLAINESLF